MSAWPLILLLGATAFSTTAADLAALEKKAKAGEVEAQYQLGEIHFEALGVKQDLPQAKRWLGKAAAQGNAKAKYRLASMLFTGRGFPANAAEGRKQFQAALPGLQKLAEAGDADARAKLGMLYNLGVAVERDAIKAAKLFTQAAEAGHHKGQLDLAGAYLLGNGIGKNPTLAGDLFEKSAKTGYVPAQVQFGILCIQGRGRRQDIPGGLKWLQAAAKSGHPAYAKKAMGLIDRLKKFPPVPGPDIDQMLAKAKAGDLKLQRDLARRHEIGHGVRVDHHASARWLRHAAAAGDGDSCYRLGAVYIMDRGIPRDANQTARLWRLASWLGHGPAQVDFAVMCAKGDGLPRDLKEAYHWMLIARRADLHPQRKKNLDAIQDLITEELDPDLIFSGLAASRGFAAPKTAAERKAVAAAAFGDGAAMLRRGQALAKSFPAEGLVWLQLAAARKVKGAPEAAQALAAKLTKADLAGVRQRVKVFAPLAPPE